MLTEDDGCNCSTSTTSCPVCDGADPDCDIRGERIFYFCSTIDKADSAEIEPDNDPNYRYPIDEAQANLVSSLCDDGMHRPVLDLDDADPGAVIEEIGLYFGKDTLKVNILPSTTRGHFHLYVDLPLRWPVYEGLLKRLAHLQMIQKSYASVSIARQASYVRKPGVFKPARVEEAAA